MIDSYPMVIAVDFDGTIVENKYPAIGEERPYAIEVLKMLIRDRHRLILWTVRKGELLQQAIDWCAERDVEFYAVNSDSSDMFKEERPGHFSCKINADLFIDDRNIGGLPPWPMIYKIITEGRSYEQMIRRKVREELTVDEPPYPAWMFWKHKGKFQGRK